MTTKYNLTARLFHWVMGTMIIIMFIVGSTMEDITDTNLKSLAYSLHKATGIVILAMAILRVLWRLSNAVPALPETLKKWQATSARLVHFGLYAILFVMPLSGWGLSSAAGYPVSVYGLFTVPNLMEKNDELKELLEDIHGVGANALLFLLAAHVGAALYHHFILKDNTLRRMWFSCPNKKNNAETK